MPKTLDELLIVVPGLRKRRSLNADLLRLLLDRAAKECTWCGLPVGKGRSKWCSDDCVRAFKARCCSITQRDLVLARDGGCCAVCGRDAIVAEYEAKDRRLTEYPYRERAMPGETFESLKERMTAAMKQLGYARGRWREVDHLTPVCEGGGLCGLENLRLLCGVCHAEATDQLTARRTGKTR